MKSMEFLRANWRPSDLETSLDSLSILFPTSILTRSFFVA